MNLFDHLSSIIMEPWQFDFMRRGIIALVLVGLSCALIGTHVILRRLSFIGDGLAHATFGGLAIGFLLKINMLVSAAFAAILTAIGIGTVSKKADISLDTSIGILFSGAFAAGIIILSHSNGYRGDLFDLLLGNVLTVSTSDLQLQAGITLVVVACLILFYKEFLFCTFDSAGASASGLPVGWLDCAFLIMVASVVTVALQTVGVVLVSALLVTPAASALQLTSRMPTMMFLSALLGMLSGIVGIYLSYYLDVPAGACIVLVTTAIFFICMAISPKRIKSPPDLKPSNLKQKLNNVILFITLSATLFYANKAYGEEPQVAHHIYGKVADLHNKPLFNIKVQMEDKDTNETQTTRTDDNGKFQFDCNLKDTYYLEVIPSAKSDLASVSIDKLVANQHLFIHLRHGFIVRGQVVYKGKKLKALTVWAESMNKEGKPLHSSCKVQTSGDGAFKLTLTPGNKKIVVQNDEYQDLLPSTSTLLTVTKDERIPDIELPANSP